MPTTYYVTVDGDDANDGLTSATAWKTLAKPSETLFDSGDEILLKCGDLFRGRLRPTYGPITISCYGDRTLGLPQVRTSLLKNNTADWVVVDSVKGIWKTYMFDQVHGESNLLYNGGFQAGSSGWGYTFTSPASGSASVIVDPDDAGNSGFGFFIGDSGPSIFNVAFYSTSAFTVERTGVYKISFYAKTLSGATSATLPGVGLMQNGGEYDSLTRETTTNKLKFYDTWTYCEQLVACSALSATDGDARVIFALGAWTSANGFPTSGLTFMIDGVSCVKVGNDLDHYDRIIHDAGHIWLDGNIYGRKYTSTFLYTWLDATSIYNEVTVSATEKFTKDGDFSSDFSNWDFFVQSNINPGLRDAEIATAYQGVLMRTNDVIVENLDINMCGGNGVDIGNASGCTVRKCKIHHIGGTNLYYPGGQIYRQGNGVNIFEAANDILIEDCHFYQCYDVALTPQGWHDNYTQNNIIFRRNVIHNNEQSYEFEGKKITSKMVDIDFIDNFCADAGNSWSKDIRPDPKGTQILQYENYCVLSGNNVSGNTFALWRDSYKFEVLPISFTSGISFYENIIVGRKQDPLWLQVLSYPPPVVTITYNVDTLNQYISESGKEQRSSAFTVSDHRKYGGFVSAPKINELPDHPALNGGKYPPMDPSVSYWFYKWVQDKF